jgi:hypothetical protein
VERDDSVCTFFGADCPHVLRFDEWLDKYTFIGPSYVHGLIDNEAFAAADPVRNYRSFVGC